MPDLLHISDRPAETDAFGRSQFAKLLAKSIVSADAYAGVVIGIEGGWGTGKSTVIGFVEKYLTDTAAEGSKPVIVAFNPWMVSNSGAMVDALVMQIAAALQVTLGAQEAKLKAGEKILGYIGLIKHLKYLKYVPGASFAGHIAQDAAEAAEEIASGVEGAQKAAEDLGKLLPHLDLARKKAEAVEALRKLERNIVVIVDDLDRLPEDEVRQVVQTIKAVADFPRTTYLLSYDRDIVAAALGGGNIGKGHSYLEKIVQVAYPIPPLFRYQLRAFIDAKLRELLAGIHVELRAFESAIYAKGLEVVTSIARHPRDVVRLQNRLLLSLPATQGEVNAVDVIVFEALSQRFPGIRDSVHRHPTDFIGQFFRGDIGVDERVSDPDQWETGPATHTGEQAWERHMPSEPSERYIATEACAFLLSARQVDDGKVPEDELRMADPDRLARFFRMTSLDNVPEAADIHRYLQQPQALGPVLTANSATDLPFLLEWIFNYTPSCDAPDVSGSVVALVDTASKIHEEGLLASSLCEMFAKVISRLIRRVPGDARLASFRLVASSAPLSIGERVLLHAAAEQGKWVVRPEMALPRERQLIPDCDAVNSALAEWTARVRMSAADGSLSKEPSLHAILYRFAQLNFAYEEAYNFVRGICTTDEGLRIFLSEYVEHNPFNDPKMFGLIEDPGFLAKRIRESPLEGRYGWLAQLVSTSEYAHAIAEQAKWSKALRPEDLQRAHDKFRKPS